MMLFLFFWTRLELYEDFGKIEFTPIEETVAQAIEYFKKYGTLGEYTHLRLNEDNK